MPSLIIERGQEKGLSYDLDASGVVVGRDPSLEIVISDPAASRRHFSILQKDGAWFLRDLESRNGTYLNEEPVAGETSLMFNDRIQVGETVFSFLEESAKKSKGGLTGKVIGGYLILDRVGRGGMGTVYRARQISLNREVALKILSSKYSSDPQFVENFVAEARAAGQLNHPNVVQVFDVGQAAGLHYFSMDFMEGGAVQDLLADREDGRLPWTEALPIIHDAASGLVYAEKRGIIHRDIKPDNLMLTSEGQVKIGDLGLAMSADAEGDGKIFGTPHFVSPEQAQGKKVTAAADIYSLGASFFRIVTGRTPFSGKTVKEILRAQIKEPHVPVVEEVPDFPPDLSAIIDKMMAKRVEDRYQTASDLLQDLERFRLDHEIELAGGRKNTLPLKIAVGVLILVAAGIGVWAATREPETIIDERTTTIVERVGTTGPIKTEEDLRRERETKAELAFLQLQASKDRGDFGLERKDYWLDLAKEYERLASEHPDAREAPRKARDRAKEIRTELERLQTEFDATVAKAEEWWEQAKAELNQLEDEGQWSAAARKAQSLLASREFKRHAPHLPEDVEKRLTETENRVIGLAQAAWAEARTKAEATLASDGAGAAIAVVQTWLEQTRPHVGDLERLQELAAEAETWIEQQGAAAREALEEALETDRENYLKARIGIRHLGEGAGSNAVFAYRFGQAADELEAAASKFVSAPYKELAAADVQRLRRMQAGWTAFVEALASGKLFGADVELQGLDKMPARAKAMLELEDPAPSLDGVSVRVVMPRIETVRGFTWSEDFTPETLGRIWIQPVVDRIEGETAAGLALAFAELGERETASQLFRRATSTGALEDEAARARLQQELDAMDLYSVVLGLRDGDPSELLKAIQGFRRRFLETDFFLLVDGGEPEEYDHRLSTTRIDRYYETWGQ